MGLPLEGIEELNDFVHVTLGSFLDNHTLGDIEELNDFVHVTLGSFFNMARWLRTEPEQFA